jgi:FkbM family methyltransferase
MFLITKVKRRPVPLNLRAMRDCRVSYSQFGEDLFLTGILGYERTSGTYVDVGCFHPIGYSNTYIFYQRGWRGIAIDPNPGMRSEWQRYRPKDIFLNFAISKAPGEKTYLINGRNPEMNTIVDDDRISQFDPKKYTVSSCKALPLREILDRHLNGRKIDFLNIDCEGMDTEILETNDFEKYRPFMIAIEDSTISADTKINQFLQNVGYEYKAYMGLTKIFQDRR